MSDPSMHPYPIELEMDATNPIGMQIHLRPIRPNDALRLVEFHQRLSTRSVYRRFLYTHTTLSSSDVDRFTTVDYIGRLAFVAEVDERLVAVGRYDRNGATTDAEVAFVVADEYQHLGIATLMLEHLADVAWKYGITTFVALTLVENREMLGVFADSGFPMTKSTDGDTVTVRMSIEPSDAYRATRFARGNHVTSRSSPSTFG